VAEYGWWLLLAAGLAVLEMLRLDLVFAMLAGGAVVGALVALGPGFGWQVAAGLVAAVGGVALVRPSALRRMRMVPGAPTAVRPSHRRHH